MASHIVAPYGDTNWNLPASAERQECRCDPVGIQEPGRVKGEAEKAEVQSRQRDYIVEFHVLSLVRPKSKSLPALSRLLPARTIQDVVSAGTPFA